MTALVELDGVSHSYGGPFVLDHVHLIIEEPSFLGVIGPSGSGKTTLLRLVLGNLRPTRGAVRRRSDLRNAYVPQVETVTFGGGATCARTRARAHTHTHMRVRACARAHTHAHTHTHTHRHACARTRTHM